MAYIYNTLILSLSYKTVFYCILVRLLFGTIVFEGLKETVMFVASISSVGFKKYIYINWGEKIFKNIGWGYIRQLRLIS